MCSFFQEFNSGFSMVYSMFLSKFYVVFLIILFYKIPFKFFVFSMEFVMEIFSISSFTYIGCSSNDAWTTSRPAHTHIYCLPRITRARSRTREHTQRYFYYFHNIVHTRLECPKRLRQISVYRTIYWHPLVGNYLLSLQLPLKSRRVPLSQF